MSQPISYSFDHVHVYCSDFAASRQWFVDKLGAEVVKEQGGSGTPSVDLRLGGATILLRAQNPGESLGQAGPSRFGTDHIGLMVDNLDAAVKELKGRGVEFEFEPREVHPGLHITFMRGPDMLRVELLQRS